MLRFTLPLLLLLSSVVWAQAEAVPQFAALTEFGLAKTWGDELSPILSTNGRGTPGTQLISTGWAIALTFDGWTTTVSSSRVSNDQLGPPSGNPRTRFVADSAELTVGRIWNWGQLLFSGSLGVGVSKLLLQTYDSSVDTANEAWAATGQASFVSDVNFSPVATSRLVWRFSPFSGSDYGWVIGAGITASGFYFPVQWKLGGDNSVSGLGKPWSSMIKPVLIVGIQ